MSGGAYSYLCFNTDELSTRRSDLESMHKRLESSGYREAARATREVIRSLDGAERMADALRNVWHAVEWVDSGDSGEERIVEAVAKFEPWPPPGSEPKPEESE